MEEINHGVLYGKQETDFIGADLPYEIRNGNGNWDAYLPPGEWQRFNHFDSFACVTFSALNSIETQYFFLTGKHVNFSDRFTAKMSETIPGKGNYLYKVADSIRNHGVLFEEEWPTNPEYSEATYYAEIPQELKERAKKRWDELGFEKPLYAWIEENESELRKHLKHAPLQAVIPGHAVIDYHQIAINWNQYDSYAPFKKVYPRLPISVMKIVLTPKNMATDKLTMKEIEQLQALEGYKDFTGGAYWVDKPLQAYLNARLEDKVKTIQATLKK